MQTRELTANGHARFDDADFAQILHRNDLPLQAMDPTQSHGPIAQERKPLRSVAFQKLLAEIECEEGAEPEANRPAFPLQALPQALREWVEECREILTNKLRLKNSCRTIRCTYVRSAFEASE